MTPRQPNQFAAEKNRPRKFTTMITQTVLNEFPELTRNDIANILSNYYDFKYDLATVNRTIELDAQKNFLSKAECISRIVRKHLGRPETPDITFYPESDIDAEINKRIEDMVERRKGWNCGNKTNRGIRKDILRDTLFRSGSFIKIIPKDIKSIEKELNERTKITELSREEVIRCLYCSYFKLGVESTKMVIRKAPEIII